MTVGELFAPSFDCVPDLLVCLFPVAVQRVKGQRKGNRLETEVRDGYECLFWFLSHSDLDDLSFSD